MKEKEALLVQHTNLTFSYLLYEVVNDEAEYGHENAKDQDEEPVNDVRKDLGGCVVPCPCEPHEYHRTSSPHSPTLKLTPRSALSFLRFINGKGLPLSPVAGL